MKINLSQLFIPEKIIKWQKVRLFDIIFLFNIYFLWSINFCLQGACYLSEKKRNEKIVT